MSVELKKGQKVKIRDDCIHRYFYEVRSKCSGGRVGIVIGYQGPWREFANPIIHFPASGRKKFYDAGFISQDDLELVE